MIAYTTIATTMMRRGIDMRKRFSYPVRQGFSTMKLCKACNTEFNNCGLLLTHNISRNDYSFAPGRF